MVFGRRMGADGRSRRPTPSNACDQTQGPYRATSTPAPTMNDTHSCRTDVEVTQGLYELYGSRHRHTKVMRALMTSRTGRGRVCENLSYEDRAQTGGGESQGSAT